MVPAKASLAVRVSYQPGFADWRSINNFRVRCENGNELGLTLRGSSRRFNVYLSTASLNFGEVKLESTATRVLTIVNDSELDTDFEFYADDNVFLLNERRGTVGRASSRKVVVEFRPRNTVAYY